jgi:hypothetical protein
VVVLYSRNSDNYKQGLNIVPNANLLENKSNEMQKSHASKQMKWIYYMEERRKEVAQMLAQGHTETEIAQLLHVHVSTISRDVKVLKQLSQRFAFDLAKGDLTYYYKQCIDGMDEIRREAWSLYKYGEVLTEIRDYYQKELKQKQQELRDKIDYNTDLKDRLKSDKSGGKLRYGRYDDLK